MATFHLSIVTPDGVVFEDDAEALAAPGACGSFGVLANHAPMVAAVEPGDFKITAGKDLHFAVGFGILEVDANSVTFLSDHATKAESHEDAIKIASTFPRQ